MAIIGTNASQKAARAMLLEVIREEAGRHALTSTSELTGYFLAGLDIATMYNNAEVPVNARRIAAPEFLSGLLSNNKV